MLCRIMRAPILRLAPIVLLLGACATVDRQPGFRTEQVAALENAGFQRVGENYELGLQDRVLFAVDRSDLRPEIAESLARLCEESGRRRMKQFLALLEPLAILLIGSAIGVIMIGIILAITSANDIAI